MIAAMILSAVLYGPTQAQLEGNIRDEVVKLVPADLDIWRGESATCVKNAIDCLQQCHVWALNQADSLIRNVDTFGWDARYLASHKIIVDFVGECADRHVKRMRDSLPKLANEVDALVLTGSALIAARAPGASGISRETQTGIANDKYVSAKLALKLKLQRAGRPELAAGI